MITCFHIKSVKDLSLFDCRKSNCLCACDEDGNVHEWAWDDSDLSISAHLSDENREVCFHPGYSSGTAAVRANKPCVKGFYHFWEIKVLTPVYGTDVMIGVGTSKVNLRNSEIEFCSFLGSDGESWGYSYRGSIHHNGKMRRYGQPFVQGSVVGVFADMCRGTITFFLNRKCLGIAFTSLTVDELYPMVCSTAAESSMRVIYSFSCAPSLQLFCLQSISTREDLLEMLYKIPGLCSFLGRTYWWLMLPVMKSDSSDEQMMTQIGHCNCDSSHFIQHGYTSIENGSE